MRKIILAAGVLSIAGLMAGCSSAVKLDNVPVEDKTGTLIPQGGPDAGSGAGGMAGDAGKGGVKGVDLGGTSGQDAINAAGPRVVYFDYDSFIVKPEYQGIVESHARLIKGDKSRKVAIEGHTDERGGREYNLALGQKRAEAVRRAMALLGVADNQMEAVSFGKEKPVATGTDEASLAKNRRAEIAYH